MTTRIIALRRPPPPPQAPAEVGRDLVHHTGKLARGPGDAFVSGTQALGHVVTAPLKIVLTPVVGLTVGSGLGLVRGMCLGATLPIMFGAIASDMNMRMGEDRRGPYQRGFETGLKVACYVTLMVVAVPVCAAAGAVLGAAAGAVTGTAHGISEGYQASWRGEMPSLAGYFEGN